MFTISYKEFVDNNLYSDFVVNYMPGLKVSMIHDAIVTFNISTKVAYVYNK